MPTSLNLRKMNDMLSVIRQNNCTKVNLLTSVHKQLSILHRILCSTDKRQHNQFNNA